MCPPNLPTHESSQPSHPGFHTRNGRRTNLSFEGSEAASYFSISCLLCIFFSWALISFKILQVLLPTFKSYSFSPSLSAQSLRAFAWPPPHQHLSPCPSCGPHLRLYVFQPISFTANSTWPYCNSSCLNQPVLPHPLTMLFLLNPPFLTQIHSSVCFTLLTKLFLSV